MNGLDCSSTGDDGCTYCVVSSLAMVAGALGCTLVVAVGIVAGIGVVASAVLFAVALLPSIFAVPIVVAVVGLPFAVVLAVLDGALGRMQLPNSDSTISFGRR